MESVSLLISVVAAVIAGGSALIAWHTVHAGREALFKALNAERETTGRLVDAVLSIQNRSETHVLRGVSVLVTDELREEIRRSISKAVHEVSEGESAWFWQPSWQQGEREADGEIARGETVRFDSDDDFESFLRDQPAADAPVRAESKS